MPNRRSDRNSSPESAQNASRSRGGSEMGDVIGGDDAATGRSRDRINSPRTDRRTRGRRRLRFELLAARRVLASITGTVFDDIDFSMHQNDEDVLAQRIVFADFNANDAIDAGEPVAITDDAGEFRFDDLPGGEYPLKLYNGTLFEDGLRRPETNGQIQTVAIDPTIESRVTGFSGLQALLVGSDPVAASTARVLLGFEANSGGGSDDGGIDDSQGGGGSSDVRTTGSITFLDLRNELGQPISTTVEGATDAVRLADGSIVVSIIDHPDGGVRVRSDGSTDDSINLSGGQPIDGITSIALTRSGRGVAIPTIADATQVNLRMIDATSPGSIAATTSEVEVPADSQVYADTGSRVLVVSPQRDGDVVTGNQVRLVSAAESSVTQIVPLPKALPGTEAVLDFNEAAGLVAFSSTGGVSVFDVNNQFNRLYRVASGGPSDAPSVAGIDHDRDRLLVFSPNDSVLRLYNLDDGVEFASVALDVSGIGAVVDIIEGDYSDSVVVLGESGLIETRLNRPVANEAVVESNASLDGVLFGATPNGTNTAPMIANSAWTIAGIEDQTLSVPISTLRSDVIDAEADNFVILPVSQPTFGSLNFDVANGFEYVPAADFFGNDAFDVWLHDGRDYSIATVNINIAGTPDPPSNIDINVTPVGENVPLGGVIGTIIINDVDGGGHAIAIDDPRFDVNDQNEIIVVEGPINFEDEPSIPISVTIEDDQTGDIFNEDIVIEITDENDPITEVTLDGDSLTENEPDAIVGTVGVIDQDIGGQYVFTVGDNRFTIVDGALVLVPGITLDFESEPIVTLDITATEDDGSSSLTETFAINVINVVEQPQQVELTGTTIGELIPGEVVGEILIDGAVPDDRFEITVNDPRFEVIENVIQLNDDEVLDTTDDTEVSVVVTVTDTEGEFDQVQQDFIIEVEPNEYPAHNLDDPFDVNHDGDSLVQDALIILNYLNVHGPTVVDQDSVDFSYDVSGDGVITTLDALLVINHLNDLSATPEAEQEDTSGGLRTGGGNSADFDGEGEFLPIDYLMGPQRELNGSDPLDQSIDEIFTAEELPPLDFTVDPELIGPCFKSPQVDEGPAEPSTFEAAFGDTNDWFTT